MTTGLKLGPLADEKPVKLTVELPADLFRDLTAYGQILGRVEGSTGGAVEPARLIVPMLQRFIASDRGFARRGVPHVLKVMNSPRRMCFWRSANGCSWEPGQFATE